MEKADRLCAAIKKVLRASIRAGGSSLRDYRNADGDVGFFQNRFNVYNREGQACPGCTCDIARTGGIKKIVQAGRSTFYCPRKQK
jgi:formamidopyrimidine-DNA glycosylase